MKHLNGVVIAALLVASISGPAQAASQVIEQSCYKRITWGEVRYNGTHVAGESDPRTVRYTIDLARQRWKSASVEGVEPWTPFARATDKEIYLLSLPGRQVILRRADLQILEGETQSWTELDNVSGVVVWEGRCKRLPAKR